MLTERLQARCPSARPVGNAIATGYSLEFFKRSKDGSGKATLVESTNPKSLVFGVLFEIKEDERHLLDKAEGEGRGYDRVDDFIVDSLSTKARLSATTYIAPSSAIDRKLEPFNWYLDLVLAGSEQHDLPKEYVDQLRERSSANDKNTNRKPVIEARDAILEFERNTRNNSR